MKIFNLKLPIRFCSTFFRQNVFFIITFCKEAKKERSKEAKKKRNIEAKKQRSKEVKKQRSREEEKKEIRKETKKQKDEKDCHA